MKKILLFLLIYITTDLSAQTFIKNIGQSKINDGATCIAKSVNGFYIAGYSNDLTYIAEVDYDGELLWKDVFDFTEQPDYITHIEIANNKLIGCGYGFYEGGSDFLEFYFRYDLNKKTFDWVKKNNQKLKPAKIQSLPNGNYLLSGDVYGSQGFRMFFAELNPNNGKTIRYSTWYFTNNESATSCIIHNNSIYSGGRYGLEKKIDKYRGAISKFDLNFNEVWSNYYLNKKEKFLRNYLSKIIIDDNALISLYFTNNHGINSYYTVCLAKQSLEGELLWAKEFELEGYKNITVRDIKASNDGYYLYGYTKSPTENLYIIKTDKEGNVLWSKTYGSTFNDNLAIDQGNFMELHNNAIYTIGQSINLNDATIDYDAFLMKVKTDGSADVNCWEKDVKVINRTFTELIQGGIYLNREDSTIRNYNVGYKIVKKKELITQPYFCYTKIAKNDKDTIFNTKSIVIDFLKNDILPQDEKIKHELISEAIYGTATIEDSKISYTQSEANICALDSFWYRIFSENGSDTALVYIYTQGDKNLFAKLQDTTLSPSGSIRLNAELSDAKYQWSTLETTPNITVNTPGKYTVKINKKGCVYSKTILVEENPYSFENVAINNITFLLDASISMNRSDRLPILKKSLYNIMSYMREEDRFSIINFSSEAKLIFDGIKATKIDEIKEKIEDIKSEGRVKIKEGVALAFKTTEKNHQNQGNNRIIFTTDGDIQNEQRVALIEYIKKALPKNTFFTIFLFNNNSVYKAQMQDVADAVNGSLYVISSKNVEKIILKELKAIRK